MNKVYIPNKINNIKEYDIDLNEINLDFEIDFLVLYSELNNYKKENSCICFYEYDKKFDGINGIFNAIYYKNEKLLEKYKQRFKDVKYIIGPDYSQFGDIHFIENLYRFYKARIVLNWFYKELNIIPIPNITAGNDKYFEYMLDGYLNCNVVAFSTKGMLHNQESFLLRKLKYTVNNLKNLKKIIIYNSTNNNQYLEKLFEKILKGKDIELIIPKNLLKERNRKIKDKKIKLKEKEKTLFDI